jgi:hypothetical protein
MISLKDWYAKLVGNREESKVEKPEPTVLEPQPVRRLVSTLLYDTELAEKVAWKMETSYNGRYMYYKWILYRTDNGRWFRVNYLDDREQLTPLDTGMAEQHLRETLPMQQLLPLLEKHFNVRVSPA